MTKNSFLLVLCFFSLVLNTPKVFAQQAVSSIAGMSLQILTDSQKKALENLGIKSLSEQVEVIKKEADLELLSTTRKGGRHYFDFIGAPTRSVEDISEIEGLYGKAVCPKDNKYKILIAQDAPPTTILHEYAHILQMKDDKRWCELDGRPLETTERQERALLYHRFEFDVLKSLWDMKDKITLNFEDRIILVEGLNRENTTLKAVGFRPLDEDLQKKILDELEEARSEIHLLLWINSKIADTGSTLQKMEVLTLKGCVEGTSGTILEKINGCLEERCKIAGQKCPKVTSADLEPYKDDIFSEIIYVWLMLAHGAQISKKQTCQIADFKEELSAHVEESSLCWKQWYEEYGDAKVGAHKSLKLSQISEKEGAKDFGAPPMKIDKDILFFKASSPEGFINRAYCYFIFQKVAKFGTLPIDQFSYATQGAALSLDHLDDYRPWLEKSNNGQTCSKLVKAFSGEEPSKLKDISHKKKYMLIINELAGLSAGVEKFRDTVKVDVNHERLHLVFAASHRVQDETKKAWEKLPDSEKDNFKKKHPSYDFSNQEILLREYFSYGHQEQLNEDL